MPASYPYVPRSNARLLPGELWSIPLSSGRFACGVVLAVPHEPNPDFVVNARAFLGGLLEWEGGEPPSAALVAGAALAAQGFVHIKTITETGGEIIGRLETTAAIRPRRWRSPPGRTPSTVYDGIEPVRRATEADSALPLISFWGYGYMRELAEQAGRAEGAR
jgi:hypothetical protein